MDSWQRLNPQSSNGAQGLYFPTPKGYMGKMEARTLITVVETEPYLSMIDGNLDDDERVAVVNMIAADPQAGDLIKETGGLRKVRIPLQGRGKRGGGRLITFFHDLDMPVFLIAFYAKNAQVDLNPKQRKAAKVLTDAIRAQYGK